MAIMINCARDWTYDKYVEDVKAVKAGHEIDTYSKEFVQSIIKSADKFLESWKAEHDGKYYDHGWVGDAFKDRLYDMDFSDWYKEAYNQRPHLDYWYYVHVLGLPMRGDSSRLFDDDPVGDAMEYAKYTRERLD